MKELEPPHTDWVTARNKPYLGGLKLTPGKDPTNPKHLAASLFSHPTDAGNFSRLVKKGIDRLLSERARRKGDGQTLKHQLRSLFTTMEMNLVTDSVPFRQREKASQEIEIPVDFFVDARLVRRPKGVPVALAIYQKALKKIGARFADKETPRLVESHHAFSVPARSYIDNRAIDALIKQGLLDEDLVTAVLAVDFTTPVYSRLRAGLLKYVPERARNAADLRAQLIVALRQAPRDPAARGLLTNLTDPRHGAKAQRAKVQAYLQVCAKARTSFDAVLDWLHIAAQRRLEVAQAETATHPKGKITEPGFKLLFPLDNLEPQVSRWVLNPRTGRREK
jgi:hypothetical protein